MDATAFSEANFDQRYGRLLSCSVPASGFSFTRFLAAAEGQPRFYWAGRDRSDAWAGIGAAVELMAWGEERFSKIESYARALFAGAHVADGGNGQAGPRLFGGFAFRGDFTPDNTWSIYSPAFFVLPHYQLLRSGGQTWLTINAQVPRDEAPEPLIPDLKAALAEKIERLTADARRPTATDQSAILGVDYPMSRADWERMLAEATGRINAGELQKIVLARAAELRFAERVKLLPVLRHLADHYANCYRFLFEPRPSYAFYGASPELLASVRGPRLQTMALAGSIGRGRNDAADRALGQDLLNNPKERLEHDIVLQKMRQRLTPLARSVSVSPTRLLKLSNIQHLSTDIDAELCSEMGALPIVEALHPTPALGGDPREKAVQLIRALEPIPRGWYGAPVGWIDAQLDGEFAVAIRSAVAQESRAWIYAGAGIVAGSQADSEWAESELKFRPMLDAHGAN